MRKFALLAAACAFAAPLPAFAQMETVDPDVEYSDSEPVDSLTEKLGDHATQEHLAATVAALSDVLLDMPLAPLAKALADAGVEAADEVPPDTTLRQLSPEAGHVLEEIADKLPAMMDAIASMAVAMRELAPVLEGMAERVKQALPAELPDERFES